MHLGAMYLLIRMCLVVDLIKDEGHIAIIC